MRFDALLKVGVASVLPVLLWTTRAVFLLLLPMRYKQIFVLSGIGIIDLWEAPLIRIGAWSAEIEEAFFRWLGNPIHSVVDSDLSLLFSSAIVHPEAHSLELPLIIAALVFCLVLLCCVFLDELWLKILIDLFLLLLTRSGLFVFVVVLPGAMYEVEVATDVVLWVL